MIIEELIKTDVNSLNDFQPSGWKDILPIFDFYTTSNFCFPIKATIENKIIGIGSLIIHNNVSWLAHIIVHPDARNKGIGKRITEKLVAISKAKKCKTIYLIATDLGAAVYEKVGFKTETEYLFFKALQPDKNWTISNKIAPFSNDLKDQILKMDKKVSQENRMFCIEEHLQCGHYYKNDNILEGFYLPSFGEGLIIATTDSAGLELMKLRLKSETTAAFPSDNLIAKEFMNQNNYKAYKKAKRMRLGIKRPVIFSNIYNRIGGDIG